MSNTYGRLFPNLRSKCVATLFRDVGAHASAVRRSSRFGVAALLFAVLLLGAASVTRLPPTRTEQPIVIPLRSPSHRQACRAVARCCVAASACTDLYGVAAGAGKARSKACGRGTTELNLPSETMLSGVRHVVVIGDSTARRVYEALWARLLVPPPEDQPRVAGRHADHRVEIQRLTPSGDGIVLEFLWRPFAANVRLLATIDPYPNIPSQGHDPAN